MFYQIFLKLCAQKNVKPNHVTKAIGMSNATATDWKNGRIPRDVTLQKLSNYFGVTVDYLLGKDQSPSPRPSENTVTLFGRDGSKTDRTLTEEQYKLFLGLLDQMPDDNKK